MNGTLDPARRPGRWERSTTAYALCLVSGALYAALFPPLGWSALAWVALVPFFVACTRMTPARAAAGGLLWALAATVGIAWWLPETLSRYFDVSPAAAWGGFVAIGVLMDGLPYAALGAWLAWVSRRSAASGRRPLVWPVAAAWAVAEWSRVNGWLGNPFGLLAYSQHGTTLAQVADLAGPYGVAALLVAANAALAGVVAPVRRGARPLRALAGVGAVVAAAWVYGQARLAQTFGDGAAISVAVVQAGFERERHGNGSASSERLARYLELTQEAAQGRPALVFWPEFSIDFYLRDATPERDTLLAYARGLDAELVLGAPDYRRPAGPRDEPAFYNSVFLLRSGELAGRHDKVRLVPFAEYGPLGDSLRADTALYAAGDGPRLLDSRPARIGAFVCGEALYPDLVRALVRQGSELLANPSNDYWLAQPAAARQQVQIAAFRAIENRRFVVRSTPTGTSAVIDAHGRVVVASRFGAPDLLRADVRRSDNVTFYGRVGDAPCAFAALLVLTTSATLFVRSRAPRHRR